MGSIRSTVGLASGINTGELINSLISLQRAPIVRLERRSSQFQATDTALKTLEANLLSLSTAAQALAQADNFTAVTVSNSDESQLAAKTTDDVVPGTYEFQTVRLATTSQALSKGFANHDQQSVGTGTLTIANGGQLNPPTPLDVLNSGNGVRLGTIRITDRSGQSADIDLSSAYSVDDVLQTINDNDDISITASTTGGKITLTDTTGQTINNLAVANLNGGQTADDLGILQSVASDSFEGTDVFSITGDFTLAQLNDGNAVRRLTGAPDIRITATDDTVLEINLDDAISLNDVVLAINSHEDNGGKITASFTNGHLEIEDTSGGGGSESFAIEDINGTNVIEQLGIDTAVVGNKITGNRLVAGANSVLLTNLRGGQGIDQTGSITLTDRTGATATLDLSAAESLDEVLSAINSAETGGSVKLQLTATLNANKTGIIITDDSGDTASNFKIADVGGSTLATQLGIVTDTTETTVDSGSLNLRYVGQSTSIEKYAPDGKSPEAGSIRLTDSDGNSAIVEISSAVKTVGDIIQRINAAADIFVTAELNETGDGFVLIDEAGGGGTLTVEEIGSGTTAADLRLLADATTGGDGKQRVTSRLATVIDVEAGDTLDDIVTKINESSGYINATIFNDGSAFNSQRLKITATDSGFNGRFLIDDNGLNLGLTSTAEGNDALLRIGGNVADGFLIASNSNSFENAFTGIDIETKQVSSTTAKITVTRDDSKLEKALSSFVSGYNAFTKAAKEQTKFDPVTNRRGILQGSGAVLRVQSRLESLASRRFGPGSATFNSLIDLGIRSKADGTLEFNKDRLTDALSKNRQAVNELLTTETTGVADIVKSVVESLTDSDHGIFALESESLQTSIKSIANRVETLDSLLVRKRDRLIQQFAAMENILSSIQTQQQAINAIPIPRSIL